MMYEMTLKVWLTNDELGEYLGVQPSTVRAWFSEGRVPYIKIPGSSQVRFHRETIDEWMKKGAVKPVYEQLEDQVKQKDLGNAKS